MTECILWPREKQIRSHTQVLGSKRFQMQNSAESLNVFIPAKAFSHNADGKLGSLNYAMSWQQCIITSDEISF